MKFATLRPGSAKRPWWQPVQDYATSAFGHIVEVVDNTSHFERQLFSVALGIAAVWVLFSTMVSPLVSPARPMCSPPIISIPSCRCGPPTYTNAGRPVYWADYPKLVDLQARTSNQLLDEKVSYEEFVMEVKKAERVSNSLRVSLGMSDLKRRNEIAGRLSKLVDEMRVAGRSMHSLGGKIQGAVDSYVLPLSATFAKPYNPFHCRVAILNEYALQTIEASRAPPSLAARFLPFSLSNSNPTKRAVMETFLLLMDNTISQTASLRKEAETSMVHLIALHGIIHRGKDRLKAARREGTITKLWGSRLDNPDAVPVGLLKEMDLILDSLRNVENHRRKALANVIATLQTLQTLDADMEELRTRVAAPDIVGDKISTEMHLKSIRAGVDRMKER